VCRLPVKSPWLNPIEPRWLHGKRAIVEPQGDSKKGYSGVTRLRC
jgi:hypothetical protein